MKRLSLIPLIDGELLDFKTEFKLFDENSPIQPENS